MHGHSYKVEVEVSGYPDDNGIVVDFKALKYLVDEVLNTYDHTNLNKLLGMENVTAEVLVERIWDELKKVVESGNVELERVRVWEGYKYYAEVRRSEQL